MQQSNFEMIVIGGGVIGSSIAYHLARQGRQVLVIERSEGACEPAASWASAGGVRRQGRHPADRKSTRLNSSNTVISYAVFCLKKKNVDRKSTRLNSSHTVISYAVFCLKKKKKK